MSLPSLCEHFIHYNVFIYHLASVIFTKCILYEFVFFALFRVFLFYYNCSSIGSTFGGVTRFGKEAAEAHMTHNRDSSNERQVSLHHCPRNLLFLLKVSVIIFLTLSVYFSL